MKRLLPLIFCLFVLTSCSQEQSTSPDVPGSQQVTVNSICNAGEILVPLGAADNVAELYSNTPKEDLAKTILHWFEQTLDRDGFKALGAQARVTTADDEYYLCVSGPAEMFPQLQAYKVRLRQFLLNGWRALGTVAELEQEKRWDPEQTGNWRFFLPLGLPMINQRALQFFHYPPIRLLTNRDYLHDPVPKRWEQLLEANGVAAKDVALYETVLDGAPIGAPDDAGPLIPIDAFALYQNSQLRLLLRSDPTDSAFTIPVVVYGVPAMYVLEKQYHINLDILVPQLAEDEKPKKAFVPGKKTAVLGANHPYHFFAQAQIDPVHNKWIGSGQLGPGCGGAEILMVQDLIAACWQVGMASDPSKDPGTQLNDCTNRWTQPSRKEEICALVQHQGSLELEGPEDPKFDFSKSLEQAQAFCKANNNDPCAGTR